MTSAAIETIVAIATPAGRGGVGIVRISGKNAASIARALTQKTLNARRATVCTFHDANDDAIDHGIALFFTAPQSYTGEDVLELHGHGSVHALQALVARCIALGARHAQPGEFTQRAFLNHKLDLAQAEAVADLIDASTATAARAAVRSLSGAFSAHIKSLQEKLIRLRMFTEATLDFPEEEGVDFIEAENARGQGEATIDALDAVLAQAKQGQLLHDGIRIAVVGAPNVGKSSLLNRLAGEELAIVTPIAGTTRDTVRATLSLKGLPCEVIDTAGVRETNDEVERIGIARTLDAIEKSDIVVLLHDATQPMQHTIAPQIQSRLPQRAITLQVMNKVDASPPPVGAFIAVSAKTGAGIDGLIEAIASAVGYTGESQSGFLARARHIEAIARARTHLVAGLAHLSVPALELFAEELRLAHRALGEVVGEFTADDLLGEIFGSFCIGK